MPCPHCGCSAYWYETTDKQRVCDGCGKSVADSEWIDPDLNQEEPDPVPNDHPAVWDLVIQDMRKRDEKGRHDYHVPLQPFNHRNSRRDLQEELADAMAYNKQAEIEWEWLMDRIKHLYFVGADSDLPTHYVLQEFLSTMQEIGDRFPFVKERDSE